MFNKFLKRKNKSVFYFMNFLWYMQSFSRAKFCSNENGKK